MKFKDWFLAWPDNVIKNSTFTCIGGPKKWHFYIDEEKIEYNTVNNLRWIIKNGWGPAEYDVVNIKSMNVDLGDLCTDSDRDYCMEVKPHFIILCKEHKDDIPTEDIIKLINAMAEE